MNIKVITPNMAGTTYLNCVQCNITAFISWLKVHPLKTIGPITFILYIVQPTTSKGPELGREREHDPNYLLLK